MRTTLSLRAARGQSQRLGHGPGRSIRLAIMRHRRPLILLTVLVALWITIRSAAPPPEPTVDVAVAAHNLPAGATVVPSDLRVAHWPASIAPTGRLPATRLPGRTVVTPIQTGEPLTTSRLLGPGLLAGQPRNLVAVTIRVADPATLSSIETGDQIDVVGAAPQPDPTSEPNPASQSAPAPESAPSNIDPTPPSAGDGSIEPSAPDPAQPAGDPSLTAARIGPAERIATGARVLAVPVAGADGSADGNSGGAADSWSLGSNGTLPGTGDTQDPSTGTPSGVVVLAVDDETARRLTAAAMSQPLSVIILRRR